MRGWQTRHQKTQRSSGRRHRALCLWLGVPPTGAVGTRSAAEPAPAGVCVCGGCATYPLWLGSVCVDEWELKLTRELLVQSCAALGQCQREGTYLFSQGAQRHHLLARLCTCKTACICREGRTLFSSRHKELHRLPVALCNGGFLGDERWKKRRTKAGWAPSNSAGRHREQGLCLNCFVKFPRLYHKELGPSSFLCSKT